MFGFNLTSSAETLGRRLTQVVNQFGWRLALAGSLTMGPVASADTLTELPADPVAEQTADMESFGEGLGADRHPQSDGDYRWRIGRHQPRTDFAACRQRTRAGRSPHQEASRHHGDGHQASLAEERGGDQSQSAEDGTSRGTKGSFR